MDIVIRGLRYRNARIFFSCEHSIYLEGIFSTFCSYSSYCKVFNNCDVLVIQVLRQLLILFFLLEVVTFFSFVYWVIVVFILYSLSIMLYSLWILFKKPSGSADFLFVLGGNHSGLVLITSSVSSSVGAGSMSGQFSEALLCCFECVLYIQYLRYFGTWAQVLCEHRIYVILYRELGCPLLQLSPFLILLSCSVLKGPIFFAFLSEKKRFLLGF